MNSASLVKLIERYGHDEVETQARLAALQARWNALKPSFPQEHLAALYVFGDQKQLKERGNLTRGLLKALSQILRTMEDLEAQRLNTAEAKRLVELEHKVKMLTDENQALIRKTVNQRTTLQQVQYRPRTKVADKDLLTRIQQLSTQVKSLSQGRKRLEEENRGLRKELAQLGEKCYPVKASSSVPTRLLATADTLTAVRRTILETLKQGGTMEIGRLFEAVHKPACFGMVLKQLAAEGRVKREGRRVYLAKPN